MTKERKYCKHCGQPYNYQGSGYGCLDADNDERYCPECMGVILKSLKNTPIKVVKKYRVIEEISYVDNLLPLKKQYEQKIKKDSSWYEVTSLESPIDPEATCIEKYYLDGYEYRVEFDGLENVSIYVLFEYYPKNDTWGRRVRTNKSENKYVPLSNIYAMTNALREAYEKPTKAFEPIDPEVFEWDILIPYSSNKPITKFNQSLEN